MAAAAPTHAPVSSSACRSGFSSSDVSFPNFRSAAASAPGWRRREPYPAVSVVSSSPQSVPGAITVDTEVWSFPSPNEICFSLISYYLGPNLLGIGADCKPHWGGNPFRALSALLGARSATLPHDGYKPWMRIHHKCCARFYLHSRGVAAKASLIASRFG